MKKKLTKPPLTVKLEGTLDDNLRALTPDNPVYEWKVGFEVIVDAGKSIRSVGVITSVLDDIFVMVEINKSGESIQVNRNRLSKK